MGQSKQMNMQALWDSAMLDAGSAAWLEGLYETFLRSPNEVDVHWRDFFATLPRVDGVVAEVPHSDIRAYFRNLTERSGGLQTAPAVSASNVNIEHERKQVKVLQFINAHRFRGHQAKRK